MRNLLLFLLGMVLGIFLGGVVGMLFMAGFQPGKPTVKIARMEVAE